MKKITVYGKQVSKGKYDLGWFTSDTQDPEYDDIFIITGVLRTMVREDILSGYFILDSSGLDSNNFILG